MSHFLSGLFCNIERLSFYNIELFQQSRQTANTIKKSFNLQLFCISFDWRLKALNIICDYR